MSDNPLLNRPPNPDLDVTYGPRKLGGPMKQLCNALLYIASVVALVATIYYAIPGFAHVFAWGDPGAVQPTHIAVSVIVFLVSLRFLPAKKKQEGKEDDQEV